jgi:hypothetical protein
LYVLPVGRGRDRYAPHVLGWLDRRDEFEDNVCDAYNANDGPEDLVNQVIVEEDRCDKDVDCAGLVLPLEVGKASTYRLLGR